MAHHKIRDDKACLNCGTLVHDRFCPHCGQENIETRHPFHYLFGHFAEDVTHYDSGFWKTIKYLLFRPGRLTIEYLAGRRASYVPPVKLYIFISFITFFLMAIVPSGHHPDNINDNAADGSVKANSNGAQSAATLDSLSRVTTFSQKERAAFARSAEQIRKKDTPTQSRSQLIGFSDYRGIKTVRQLDSMQESLSESERPAWWKYFLKRKYLYLREEGYSDRQIVEKYSETFEHNIPKAIFFYLPFFAFWLWLFHNKKKWYYFDHGIFSLHYFAFLLACVTIIFLITHIVGLFDSTLLDVVRTLICAFIIGYMFFYFFRSHSRVYKERKAVSRLKGVALFFINFIFMIVFLTGFMCLTLYNLN